MITVSYRCLRTGQVHREECGNERTAYELMKHVNLSDTLKGLDVEGTKKYFCGGTGTFYNDNSGKISQPVGREKRIGV